MKTIADDDDLSQSLLVCSVPCSDSTRRYHRVHVWTTHDEYLVVFITVQYLIGIDAVVSVVFCC